MVMSDRIALLRGGNLEQIAAPRDIYNRPATSYVAQFIGHTNLLRGHVERGVAHCGSLAWPVGLTDGPCAFSVRPENIRLATGACNGVVRFEGRLLNQAFHGATELLRVESPDGTVFSVQVSGLPTQKIPVALPLEFAPQDAIPVRDEEAG
jgi:ABC-type Fe3+/spermidine/putrescine transport system ATPase subunit